MAEDACFSGLFATAAEAEAAAVAASAVALMAKWHSCEPEEVTHQLKSCAVLHALPDEPFPFPELDEEDA